MKRFAIILAAVLVTTTAKADTIAQYVEEQGNSDKIVIYLDKNDSEINDPRCTRMKDPRQLSASLHWFAATHAITPYANGCWSFTEDDQIEIAMWTHSLSEYVYKVISPRSLRYRR
jgi:hypothetical protein